MFVGVILYKFKSESIDKALNEWKEKVLPEARRHPGFIKAEMFADRSTGRAMDIGYWQTGKDAAHFEDSGAYDLLMGELKDYFEAKPSRMQFEKVLES
jgi:hypothetical protein